MQRFDFQAGLEEIFEPRWCERKSLNRIEHAEMWNAFERMTPDNWKKLLQAAVRVCGRYQPTIQKLIEVARQQGIALYERRDAGSFDGDCKYCGGGGVVEVLVKRPMRWARVATPCMACEARKNYAWTWPSSDDERAAQTERFNWYVKLHNKNKGAVSAELDELERRLNAEGECAEAQEGVEHAAG